MKNNEEAFDSFIEAEDEEANGFMTTFADLMTLLLVFFVLLYSISSFNLQKITIAFEATDMDMGNINHPTKLLPSGEIPGLLDTRMSIESVTGLRKRAEAMYKDLQQFIKDKALEDSIDLQYMEGKIILMIKGQVLFSSGSADLNPDAFSVLDEISDLVNAYPEYDVNIKGHTDNIPIKTVQFPSNWELSAIRATSVLKYMIHAGVAPDRMTATGYGDVLPLVPNTTTENRSLNRRVEFVLEKKTN